VRADQFRKPLRNTLLALARDGNEERTLASRFGDDYLDYARRVSRWVG